MNKIEILFNKIGRVLLYYIDTPLTNRYYLQLLWHRCVGGWIDFENPRTYNEKIQWLKLYNHNECYTKLVDKISVKDVVEEKFGKEHVIPTIAVWDSPEEIKLENLPDEFVIKCNHDSGSVFICKNKSDFEMEKTKKFLTSRMKRNLFYPGREWAYKRVHPKVFAEKLMKQADAVDLLDYKFFCFNGKVKYIQVDIDRFVEHKRNIYDRDWNFIDAEMCYPSSRDIVIKKPEILGEMIDVAEKMSSGIPHVRVDLYYINGTWYFGEMTFYHEGGMGDIKPVDFNIKMGEEIELPKNDVDL